MLSNVACSTGTDHFFKNRTPTHKIHDVEVVRFIDTPQLRETDSFENGFLLSDTPKGMQVMNAAECLQGVMSSAHTELVEGSDSSSCQQPQILDVRGYKRVIGQPWNLQWSFSKNCPNGLNYHRITLSCSILQNSHLEDTTSRVWRCATHHLLRTIFRNLQDVRNGRAQMPNRTRSLNHRFGSLGGVVPGPTPAVSWYSTLDSSARLG